MAKQQVTEENTTERPEGCRITPRVIVAVEVDKIGSGATRFYGPFMDDEAAQRFALENNFMDAGSHTIWAPADVPCAEANAAKGPPNEGGVDRSSESTSGTDDVDEFERAMASIFGGGVASDWDDDEL